MATVTNERERGRTPEPRESGSFVRGSRFDSGLWPKEDDILRTSDRLSFELAGVRFYVEATDVVAPTTMRTRYRVVCEECAEILHRATTGPSSYIRGHLKSKHGLTGELHHAPDGLENKR